MAVNSVLAPYPSFFDATGAALENGYVYIGQPGFEARSNPKASFFDVALTIPTGTASGAAIRTKGGFPINGSNSPAMFYADGDFSISVCDRNGMLLYSALNATLALNVGGTTGPILAPDGTLGATGFGFINEANTGFIRSGVNSLQTVVGGVLVATQTPTGVVFAQPVSGAGFTTGVLTVAQPVDADLTALAGLSSTGFAVRTAGNAWAQRQITSPDGSIAITNPAGIAGDVQLSTGTIVGILTTTGATTVGPWALPAGVKRFRITSNKSSLSGTNQILVQLRVSAAFVTSGYESYSIGGGTNLSSTAGMIVSVAANTNFWLGAMEFTLHDPSGHIWVATHNGSIFTGAEGVNGGGVIDLAGAVDGIRIISSGADTFDASSFNVSY